MKWQGIFKETAYISSIHFSTKILGFVEKLLIAYLFGASAISDAYFFSFAIFILIFDFFNESTSPALLPAYVNADNSDDKQKIFNSAFSFLAVAGFFISLTLTLFSKNIINLVTGFPPETSEIAVSYLRIISMGMVFVISSITTYLFINSGRKFLPAALGDLIFKVTGSIFILYSIIDRSIGLLTLAIGIFAGSALKLFTHFVYLKRRGIDFKISFNRSFLSVFKLSLPVVAGVFFSKGRILFDNFIVSGMAVGSVTAMQLGYRVMEFSIVVLLEPFSTVLFPEFVSIVKNPTVLKDKVFGSIRFLVIILIPISFFAFVFRYEIISILFKRGAFDEKSVVLTASVFSFYILSIIFISIDILFSKVLYSFGDTKFPPIFEIISILFHIFFVLLFRSDGIFVISLAFFLNRVLKSFLLFLRIRLLLKIGKDISVLFFTLSGIGILSVLLSRITGYWLFGIKQGVFFLIISGVVFSLFYLSGLVFSGISKDFFFEWKNG